MDSLLSNWAYMVMGSLAWSLKAWAALVLPEDGRWKERHREEKRKLLRMDFTTFRNAMMRIPAQIVSAGRRIVYRLLAWNPWQHVSSACSTSFSSRYVAKTTPLKPESGCSGPFSPRTALSATESDMKHDPTRNLLPTSAASAARCVDLTRRRKAAKNTFGVRLF